MSSYSPVFAPFPHLFSAPFCQRGYERVCPRLLGQEDGIRHALDGLQQLRPLRHQRLRSGWLTGRKMGKTAASVPQRHLPDFLGNISKLWIALLKQKKQKRPLTHGARHLRPSVQHEPNLPSSLLVKHSPVFPRNGRQCMLPAVHIGYCCFLTVKEAV